MFQMFEVGIRINAAVHATDGMCGHAVCLVVDPIHEKVTHLVVEEDELPRMQRLVPIDLVHSARQEEIEIKCGTDQFKKMDTFVDEQFLPSNSHGALHRFWPYVEPETPLDLPEHQKIPAGEVALRRGTPVHATDGLIGRLDELMIDRKDGSITHLVLREGHLWGPKDISIPVAQIEKLDPEAVYLRLAKKEVEQLPQIRIRRFPR